MPPPGARRPDAATLDGVASTRSKRGSTRPPRCNPNPGLASVPAPEPRRVRARGARTCSASTSTSTRSCRPTRSATASTTSPTCRAFSPTLMEGYLRAASQISRARGRRSQRERRRRSPTRSAATASQMRHVDGAPMGTRGGISVVHTFPADGDYVFKVVAAQRAARRHLRPHVDGDDGHQGADRGVDQRRARRRCSTSTRG